MEKRITLIACFDENSNNKIEQSLKRFKSYKICKVPMNIENRVENDTLPYHITLSAWDKNELSKILLAFNKFKIDNIKIKFKFSLKDSSLNAKMLFLEPINQHSIKTLQENAYNILPTERYNPSKYKIHCTICIDNNKKTAEAMFNELKDIVLNLTINKICLYEIYPAKLIAEKIKQV